MLVVIRKSLLTVGVVTLVLCGLTLAQVSADQARADDLFGKSQWSDAAQAYSQITAKDPNNAAAWQNLGESCLQLKKYDEAAAAFTHAQELRFRPLVQRVNVARVLAEQGDRARSVGVLKEIAASGQGSRLRSYILSSSEFARFNDDPEYKQVLEAIRPCQTPEYRQFDFWVGDWQVYGPSNNVVGANQVTREQSGCLIVEHWTGAGGGETGTSFNYYDVRDKKWHQLYLDNSGNAGAFPAMAGELKDNKMVLLSDPTASPVYRWTWYLMSPGHVKQMAEQSNDGQKTWQTFWDSVYVTKTGGSSGQ